MDYEKNYKQALIRATREFDCALTDSTRNVLQEIFPELAKSEDEMIREAIISALKWANHKGVYDKHIAWLEKPCAQKPVDKIEPKFKVGDWIISDETHEDYRICKITNVENGNYTIESIYGYKGYNTFETFEKSYHLWTIQDAKDGDVLFEGKISSLPSPFIVIFKTKDSVNTFSSHCFIGFDGNFYEGDGEHYPENLHPATKEQRDLLFEKMKEAGYEWDAEKKELIKVPKPKEPEGALKHLLDEQEKLYKEAKIVLEDKDTALAFLKRTGIIDENGELSEKYRCEQTLATTVAAWSEGDERMLNHIIGYLHSGDDFQTGIDWLKSLKQRYTWKPSDEQMKALRFVKGAKILDPEERESLNSLYIHLKKLMER